VYGRTHGRARRSHGAHARYGAALFVLLSYVVQLCVFSTAHWIALPNPEHAARTVAPGRAAPAAPGAAHDPADCPVCAATTAVGTLSPGPSGAASAVTGWVVVHARASAPAAPAPARVSRGPPLLSA
jgi:hypothetical protein